MFKPETIEEAEIYEYIKNNFSLEYLEIYRYDGGLETVDKEGNNLYFWIDEHGAVAYDDYPF